MRMWGLTCSLLLTSTLWAASPDSTDNAGATVRVTSAEVHLTLTAMDAKTRAKATLSPADIVIIRDGNSIEKISALETHRDEPLSLTVLTDVSESMLPGLALERAATKRLQAEATPLDQLSLNDFGFKLELNKRGAVPGLTSLYDSLISIIDSTPRGAGVRRTLLVLTDGDDNYSYHSLADVITAAQKNDVAIYAIAVHPDRKQRYRPDVLQRLCNETGGEYFDVKNAAAVTSAIEQIVSELRNGYELVFRPGATQPGIHRISVRNVNSNIKITHRTSYFQPANTTPLLMQGQ